MSVDVLTRTPQVLKRPFVFYAVVYVAMALWFWQSDLVPGDSASRVANAWYTLFSRDPHLAAIGFVWNPLPSLILLPFLPLGLIFPALTQQGLLVVLVSAALMTATVAVLHDVLRRSDVPRTARLVLTAAFALHPMIVIYSGNGMSEACFLLCLMLAVRALVIWLADGRAEQLVPLGLAIGLAYGARYEALAPAAAVPVLVFLTTLWRTPGDRPRRIALARTDAVLAGLPGLLAVILWALAGKLIVGQWFATFSSQYGNSAQVSANATGISSVTGDDLPGRIGYWLQQMLGLAPLFVVVLVAALVVAWRRRDPRVLAAVTVLGSVLAFDALAFLSGTSFGWLRFHITVVPLTVLLAGHLIAARPRREVVTAALAAVLVAIPATVVTLGRPTLAREESEWLTADGADRTRGLTLVNRRVAADLDAMELPDGAVLTDAAYAFGIVLASDRPRQFVITPDRDFAAAVADPAGHGVRYLLLSAQGAADAVRLRAVTTAPPALSWDDDRGGRQWTLVPVAR
ncbi:hypothetical protein Aph02nite_16260 [Actinoplanes philippinensis]|uniref:Dolichyl-phosphate-mannose-protein mannosyltransferase n=1 Tax=Actinoplanes philippinensis TaxID=35752 RepID=A0A1I2B3G8_9ACTN|nr:ABC transporter [Actinoplanes philippinensis]GIE75676.1 hypothetical protein Aph02nite_16260 [Actinoplanes philippinensis]SFE50714.1 hypothetical protein SAMN05421541_10291 [Actinoplanes philippinensis]